MQALEGRSKYIYHLQVSKLNLGHFNFHEARHNYQMMSVRICNQQLNLYSENFHNFRPH
jgi:hypothetical protein